MKKIIERIRSFNNIVVLSIVLIFCYLNPNLVAADESVAMVPKHVLILHSYHPGFAWTDGVMAGMQSVLSKPSHSIKVDVEYLDMKRHRDSAYFTHILDAILHYKFKDSTYDLVLVSDNEALNFALGHSADLFLNTPIIFCGVNSSAPARLKKGRDVTGVCGNPDFEGVIKQALALHPGTNKMVVIGSTGDLTDRINMKRAQSLAETISPDVVFEFWNDLSSDALSLQLAALTSKSIVVINGSSRDRRGNLLSLTEQTALIKQATKAPIYSFWDAYLGEGIVGGTLVNARNQGIAAAEMALRVLQGESASSIPILKPVKEQPVFDYNILKQQGIPLSSLPQKHVLINAPSSSYQIAKPYFWMSVATLLGLLSITFLLTWNIVQRHRMEKELREREQKIRELSQHFQIVLDGIPDTLTLISKEMKVIWSNKVADNNFTHHNSGIVPEEYCCNVLYKRSSICDNCPAVKAFKTGLTEESIITTPDNKTLEVKAFPVRDVADDISYVIMLASDITEKNRLLEEAIRTRRLVALGELAAGVAHEINNPNALILLNAGLLKKACGDAAPILMQHYEDVGDFPMAGLPYSEMCAEMPQLFSEMFESAGRIKRIVCDLKEFALADATDHCENIELNQVVKAVIRMVDDSIKSSTNKLSIDLAGSLPVFIGNLQHIEQVIINLVMNACQALPDREKGIYVSTWYHPERMACVITVRDEGVGISKENLPHITDPFFTTKRQTGGTGLGLSVSMRIVRNYGGSLEFHSELNKGTTVNLYLPIKQEAISHEQ